MGRQCLVCALSGGVDSVVLLDALDVLRSRFSYRLEVAHVHHGLQAEADAWVAFCEDLCRARGLPLHILKVTVEQCDPDGLEAAARKARYKVLMGLECDLLAFGHHRDDQAETVLFRLLRGTGVRGAAAMRPVVSGHIPILRPLLDISRQTVLSTARARGLVWVDDLSNDDISFARNALRQRIFPLIEERFPAARATLARAAVNFRESCELLDEVADVDIAACQCQTHGLDLAALRALSPLRLANLLRRTLAQFGLMPPSHAWINEAMRQLRAVNNPLRVLLGDWALCCYRGRVWWAARALDLPQSMHWRASSGQWPWAGGVLSCAPAMGQGVVAAFLDGRQCRFVTRPDGLKLRLNARRPAKTFSSLCQERGIPPWLRAQMPVLEVEGRGIAWVGELGTVAEATAGEGEAGWLFEWVPGRS